MKVAQRHKIQGPPASYRTAGIIIALVTLAMIAGCSSQPPLGPLQDHYAAAAGDCPVNSTLVCHVEPRSDLNMESRSSCQCEFVGKYLRTSQPGILNRRSHH